MNPQADELKRRTKQFALDVLQYVRTQPHISEARSINQQLVRSAAAVGANYRSACRSRSRAEFIARIGIVLEEADESGFWLEMMIEGGLGSPSDAKRLLNEADESMIWPWRF